MATLTNKDSAGPTESNFKSSSLSKPQGMGPAIMAQGVIVDVNTKNWTVDVHSKFDRRKWFDIQTGSPYLHYNNGEGLSIMPEVGAKCVVCIPSDGTQPFISTFIAPLETRDASVTQNDEGDLELETPGGKDKKSAVDASFAAGRYPAKPGDIVARTRDGNFLILHRGGVVQIGATTLAQRIFLPIGNLVMDVSERYAHHNVGGSINWGLQEGPSIANSPTQWSQVFRVYANDRFADLRIACGKVYDLTGEPDGSTTKERLAELSIGNEDIVYEITLAQDGFHEHTGEPADKGVKNRAKFRFFFDRAGGTMLRSEANIYFYSKKKIYLESEEEIVAKTKKMRLDVAERLDGIGNTCDLAFATVALGPDGGNRRPGVRMGDPVSSGSLVPTPCIITLSATPSPGVPVAGTIQFPTGLAGANTGGNPRVKF
jgi:hypothetical protein